MINTEVATFIVANMSDVRDASAKDWESRMNELVNKINRLDQVEAEYGPGEVYYVDKEGVRYYKLNDLGINHSRACSWFMKVRNEHMVIGPGETNEALYISMQGIEEIVGHVRNKEIRRKLQRAVRGSSGLTDAEVAALKVCGYAEAHLRLKILELYLLGINSSRLAEVRGY